MNIILENNQYDIVEGENIFQVCFHQFTYHMYLSYKKSDKLIIFFNGAVDRKKSELPVFQRRTWVGDIDANVLILDDPTLQIDDKMSVGWYIGNEEEDVQQNIKKLIKSFSVALNISCKNLYFYGSSAGGFMSLIMATNFIKSTAIVNNPQVNLLNYYQRFIDLIINKGFPSISKKDFIEKYAKAYNIVSIINNAEQTPKIYYLQNICDTLHYEKHMLYFLSNISLNKYNNKINIELYSNSEEGHNPVSRQKTILLINNIIVNKDIYF